MFGVTPGDGHWGHTLLLITDIYYNGLRENNVYAYTLDLAFGMDRKAQRGSLVAHRAMVCRPEDIVQNKIEFSRHDFVPLKGSMETEGRAQRSWYSSIFFLGVRTRSKIYFTNFKHNCLPCDMTPMTPQNGRKRLEDIQNNA